MFWRVARKWRVDPHGPLQKLEDNLWCVEGSLPGSVDVRRRIAIVRHSDGSLLFYGALPFDEPTLAQIGALGTPRYLVVPHGYHRIDAHTFREKLGLAVFCPAGAHKRVSKVTRVDGTLADLPKDPAVRHEPMPGNRLDEHALLVTSGDRVSYVPTDIIQWYPEPPPLRFRMLGFNGGPKVVPMFRLACMDDRTKLAESIRRVGAIPGLARVVTCHGPIVETDAAGALERAATDLAG